MYKVLLLIMLSIHYTYLRLMLCALYSMIVLIGRDMTRVIVSLCRGTYTCIYTDYSCYDCALNLCRGIYIHMYIHRLQLLSPASLYPCVEVHTHVYTQITAAMTVLSTCVEVYTYTCIYTDYSCYHPRHCIPV